MIGHHLRYVLRILWRKKFFTIVNILGLSIGITSAFLIFLYISFERSYDSFHTKANRIYRLACDLKTGDQVILGSNTSAPMGLNMAALYPEIEAMTRLSQGNLLVRRGNIKFQETNILLADSSLFKVFDFKMLEGNPKKALVNPMSLVLTRSTARKYFGDADPIGQRLSLSLHEWPGIVTGVIQDIPENSQIKADIFFSGTTSNFDGDSTKWSDLIYKTYLLLRPGADPRSLEARFPAFVSRHMQQEMDAKKITYELSLEPLREVYLYSRRGGAISGNINNIKILYFIAGFILLVTCLNFVNYFTASATDRAKDVGIKKIIGAEGTHLIGQFLLESILFCLVAFILTVLLASLLLPLFNELAGKAISHNIFYPFDKILILFLGCLLLGGISGIYPAFVLAGFNPIKVLNKQFTAGRKGVLLRQSLIIFQFSLSIMLITGTIVIYEQLHYMRSRDLGFSKDEIMVIDTRQDSHGQAFKKEILKNPGVISAAFSSMVPGMMNDRRVDLQIQSRSGAMQALEAETYTIGPDFLSTYGIRMADGRAFQKGYSGDVRRSLIVNQTAAAALNYTSAGDIIGKRFFQPGRDSGVVIGVIKDFHARSLQETIKPFCLQYSADDPDEFISIKINGHKVESTVTAVSRAWTQLIPYRPFDFFFMDEFFDRQYRSEINFGRLALYFSILAIVVSSLGLLGFTYYLILHRAKEISIRKVLGSSTGNIVKLLSYDLVTLIIIAFLIASPVAWLTMSNWLDGYAYRIQLFWWFFFVAGMITIAIAFLTVGYLTFKAARENPVKDLRLQ